MGSLGQGVAFERRGPDVVDRPPVREGLSDLPFCNSSRAIAGRFLVAEAEHEIVPGRGEDGCKVFHKAWAIFIRQGMEEPGISGGIEFPVEPGEFQGVQDTKMNVDASCCSLLLSLLDRQGC